MRSGLKEANDQLQTADKFLNLGRSEEALAAYERAIELDPSLTQALTHITEITAQQRSTCSADQLSPFRCVFRMPS